MRILEGNYLQTGMIDDNIPCIALERFSKYKSFRYYPYTKLTIIWLYSQK